MVDLMSLEPRLVPSVEVKGGHHETSTPYFPQARRRRRNAARTPARRVRAGRLSVEADHHRGALCAGGWPLIKAAEIKVD